jgi:chromosome partitioning protein
MRAQSVTLTNQKGGPGKTTCTYHVAHSARHAGKRVLLVDADENGDLTSVAMQDPEQTWDYDVADLLSSYRHQTLTAREVIVPSAWEGVDLMPSGPGLANLKAELAADAQPGRELRLRKALAPLLDDYDLILIDSPGDVNQITANVLAAVDQAFIVVEGGLFNADAAGKALANIDVVREHYNPALTVSGLVVNRHQQTNLHSRSLEDLQAYGLPIFGPINNLVAIRESLEAAQGLHSWSREAAKIAEVYDEIFEAIEERRTV